MSRERQPTKRTGYLRQKNNNKLFGHNKRSRELGVWLEPQEEAAVCQPFMYMWWKGHRSFLNMQTCHFFRRINNTLVTKAPSCAREARAISACIKFKVDRCWMAGLSVSPCIHSFIYLHKSYPVTYKPIQSVCLSTHLRIQNTQPTCVPSTYYPFTWQPIHLPIYSMYLPGYLPNFVQTDLPIHLPTCLNKH